YVRATPWDWDAKAKLARLQSNDAALREIAASAEAPYLTRVRTAQAVSVLKTAVLNTSSTELNLLSQATPIAPSDAEKPYFLNARLASAEHSSDVNAQIRLLEQAAAIAPSDNDLKLRLFDAAYRAQRWQTAISALYPLSGNTGA